MSAGEWTSTVVALLTAHAHGDLAAGAPIVAALPHDDLIGVLGVAVSMLAHEIELGCADAGYEVPEFLELIGLAAAQVATS